MSSDFAKAEEVIYKRASNDDLKIHIFKPDGWKETDKRPAIVYYYGGGWRNAYLSAFHSHALKHSSQGFVCFIVEYRVYKDHGALPNDCLKDAQDAFAFVREHALEFAIDPNRLVASGGSAGGHLAACLGTIPDSRNGLASKPNAMVLFNPRCIVDPQNPLMAFVQELGVDHESLSPIDHVDATVPPTINFHGTSDDLVPYEDSLRFHNKLLANNVLSYLELFEGREHSFFYGNRVAPDTSEKGTDFRRTIELSTQFFVELGYLPID